jgi:hypothetical protein
LTTALAIIGEALVFAKSLILTLPSLIAMQAQGWYYSFGASAMFVLPT